MAKSRADFVNEVLDAQLSKSTLCLKYGISRVTGDKWLKRHLDGQALVDRSRVPFHQPNKTSDELEALIISTRQDHPAWGARKIIRFLQDCGHSHLPATSTASAILKRNGFISKEGSHAATPFKSFVRAQPNDLWQADFKGHFQMHNGLRCHPLTVIDDHSRFALSVDAKDNERFDCVIQSFSRMFDTYGLPSTILCDNGNPWGTSQTVGYTRFEVWMMDRDVLTIHGRPRHPQTQGKEERFNRTLNDEVLRLKVIKNLAHAQEEFDIFRDCYNHARPHHALGLDTPAKHYKASKRNAPKTIQSWIYPSDCMERKVKKNGVIRLKGRYCYLGEAFEGLTVALRESTVRGFMNVYYRNFRIARMSIEDFCFVSRKIFRYDDDVSGENM